MEREINVEAIKDIIQRYKVNVTGDTLHYQLVGRTGEATVIHLNEEQKQWVNNGDLDDEIIRDLIQYDVRNKFAEQGERIKALTSMKAAATTARAAHAFMRPLRKNNANPEIPSGDDNLSANNTLPGEKLKNQRYDEAVELPDDSDEYVDEQDIDPNMIAALQEVMNALHALVKEDASFGMIQTKLQQTATREGIMLDVPRETHVVTPSHASPATTAMAAPLPVPVSLEEHLELLEKLQKKLLDLNKDHYLTIPESVEPVLRELYQEVERSILIVKQDLARKAIRNGRQAHVDNISSTNAVAPEDAEHPHDHDEVGSVISDLTDDIGDDLGDASRNMPFSNM